MEEEGPRKEVMEEEEDDEHGSKERVLQKYFLMEWELVKSLLNDIVSHGRVSDPSSVHKIRSIVSLFAPVSMLLVFFFFFFLFIGWRWICFGAFSEFMSSVKRW